MSAPNTPQAGSGVTDDGFRGDSAALCASIAALLSLDESGALAPHGIGGHARTLLKSAAARLATPAAGAGGSVGAARCSLIKRLRSNHTTWRDTIDRCNEAADLLEATPAPEQATTGGQGAIVSAYAIPTSDKPFAEEITIQRMRQIDGPALWSVKLGGNCLNKSGEWEWEPMPSSRDDAFLARCRFESPEAAIDAAILSTASTAGEGGVKL
jgi:hypothetical protein